MADQTKVVKAKKVREGDFLVGLDDGYVFQDPGRTGYENNEVEILFHDADGGENNLTCGKDMPITVKRRS